MRLLLLIVFLQSILLSQSFITKHLVLNGTDARVLIENNEKLDLLDTDYTFEILLTLEEYNAWYQSTLFSKRTGNFNEGYFVGVTGLAQPYGKKAWIQPGHGNTAFARSDNDIPLNNLIHLAFVFNTDNNLMVIYQNGESIGVGINYPEQMYQCIEDLTIGFDGKTGDYFFKGSLDEARIWNVARSEADIIEYMNKELPDDICNDPNSGLVAYYKFNELENLGQGGDGLADDVRDYSLNGFHGDLLGDAHLESDFSGWLIPLSVMENGKEIKELEFGLEVSATDNIDSHLGESQLDPVISGVLDCRFELPDGSFSVKDFRNISVPTVEWKLLLQESVLGSPVTLSWNINDFPAGDLFLRYHDEPGNVYSTDMKSTTSVIINENISEFTVFYTIESDMDIPLNEGWNIVSLPYKSSDMTVSNLFQDAVSPVYSFKENYVQVNSVENGKGYWVKYPENSVIHQTGLANVDTINLLNGWNLIGPFDAKTNVTDIITIPSGIISGYYFGFDGIYYIAGKLVPGKGYWVKSNSAGKMVIPEVAGKTSKSSGLDNLKKLATITITGNKGKTFKLYYADCPLDDSGYELPPIPPAENQDVRFENNTFVAKADGFSRKILLNCFENDAVLKIDGVDLEYEINGQKGLLKNGKSVKIETSGNDNLIINTTGVIKTYYLSDVYPNPFNPSTTIKYNIAEEGLVQLDVYDILGKKIARLVNKEETAGEHKVTFSGKGLSSGVYFCQLRVNGNSFTKKMVLTK